MACLIKITLFIYGFGVLMLAGGRLLTAQDTPMVESVIVRLTDANGTHLYRLALATLHLHPLGRVPNNGTRLQISADHQWLIYELDRAGNLDIYRRHLHNNTLERLTTAPSPDGEPLISPDGQWIFYQTGRDLYRMRLDGSSPQRLTQLPSRKIILAVNAEWIFFIMTSSDGDDIYRVRTDGSALEEYLLSATYVYNLVLSADGEWLYFSANVAGAFDVYRMHIDGSALENLTQTPANDYLVYLTQRQDAVIYLAKQGDDLELHRLDLAERTPAILNPAETWTGMVQVTPHEEWLVYRAGLFAPEIYRIRFDGSQRHNLSQSLQTDDTPYLSPDGRTVFFISDRTGHYELYQVALMGGHLRQLTNVNAYVCCPLALPLIDMPFHVGRLLGLGVIVLGVTLGSVLRRRE